MNNGRANDFFLIKATYLLNPLNAKPIKGSNTFKQFVGKVPTNCLSVFDHFIGLALEGLIKATCLLNIFTQNHYLNHKKKNKKYSPAMVTLY